MVGLLIDQRIVAEDLYCQKGGGAGTRRLVFDYLLTSQSVSVD